MQDLQEDLGAETVKAMSQEEFDRISHERLESGLAKYAGCITSLYAQELARIAVEALNLKTRPLAELEILLGLRGQPEQPQVPNAFPLPGNRGVLPE